MSILVPAGVGSDVLAGRLRSMTAGDPVVVRVRDRPSRDALVVAPAGASTTAALADALLDPHDDVAVERFWRERARPMALRLAGIDGSSPVPPVLRDHDPAWCDIAQRLVARLALALGAAGLDRGDVGYEHIGSTAVPGLRAKPFVDLQLGVPALPDEGAPFDVVLLACGYLPAVGARPDSPGVHRDLPMFPGACPDADYRKRLFFRPDPAAPVILHVRRRGTPWHDYPLRFRDLLRSSPEHRRAYEQVKVAAAAAHADDDYDDYTRAKGDVIRAALVDAGCAPGAWERLAPWPVTPPRDELLDPFRGG